MSATIANTTELFQNAPELRVLLEQRQVDLHAKRIPDIVKALAAAIERIAQVHEQQQQRGGSDELAL